MGDVIGIDKHLRQDAIEAMVDQLEYLCDEDPMDGAIDVVVGMLLRRLEVDAVVDRALIGIDYSLAISDDECEGRLALFGFTIAPKGDEDHSRAIQIVAFPWKAGTYANTTEYLPKIIERIQGHTKLTGEYHYLLLQWMIQDLLLTGFTLNAHVTTPGRPIAWLRFIRNETVVEIEY